MTNKLSISKVFGYFLAVALVYFLGYIVLYNPFHYETCVLVLVLNMCSGFLFVTLLTSTEVKSIKDAFNGSGIKWFLLLVPLFIWRFGIDFVPTSDKDELVAVWISFSACWFYIGYSLDRLLSHFNESFGDEISLATTAGLTLSLFLFAGKYLGLPIVDKIVQEFDQVPLFGYLFTARKIGLGLFILYVAFMAILELFGLDRPKLFLTPYLEIDESIATENWHESFITAAKEGFNVFVLLPLNVLHLILGTLSHYVLGFITNCWNILKDTSKLTIRSLPAIFTLLLVFLCLMSIDSFSSYVLDFHDDIVSRNNISNSIRPMMFGSVVALSVFLIRVIYYFAYRKKDYKALFDLHVFWLNGLRFLIVLGVASIFLYWGNYGIFTYLVGAVMLILGGALIIRAIIWYVQVTNGSKIQ